VRFLGRFLCSKLLHAFPQQLSNPQEMLNTQQYSTTNFAEQDFQTPLIPADAMIYDWTMTTTQHGIRLGSDMFSNRWCSSKVSCSKPLSSKLLLSRQSQQNLTQQATVQQTFLQQSLAHPSSRATASRKPTPITLSTTWIRMRVRIHSASSTVPLSPTPAKLDGAVLRPTTTRAANILESA